MADEWEEFKRGAKKLPRVTVAKASVPTPAQKPAAKKKFVTLKVPAPTQSQNTLPKLRVTLAVPPPVDDPALLRRLQCGEMRWDAALDLHHMTEAAAHQAVVDFLALATAQGWRVLLIITGRGAILRTALPRWLADSPAVRFCHPAARRHGGDGAVYVALRRRGRKIS